jgi:CRISPR-associated protein Cas5d
MKPYPLQFEISGPIALWARPDTTPNPVSYVAPTFSAVKGIFESVLRWESVKGSAGDPPAPVGDPPNGTAEAHESTRRVAGSNRRVARATRTTNYGGLHRANDAMNKGASYSLARRITLLRIGWGEGGRRPDEVFRGSGKGGRSPGEGGGFIVVLVNVCYRLYAQAEFAGHHDGTTWPPHAYHDVFNRALDRGQWFYTPCLGCDPSPALCAGEGGRRPGEGRRWHNRKINSSSAAPDYVGPFRPETRVCEMENHELPTMLRMVFDQMQNGMN